MDLKEPLLGRPNSGSTSPRIVRKKSDHPVLSLFSPRRPSNPQPTDSFPRSPCQFEQGRGGSEFQVGSVPSRRSVSHESTFSPATSSFLGLSSLLSPELSGVGILQRIPEDPSHDPEDQPYSAEAADEQGDDLEAHSSSVEERNGYNDEANDTDTGVFGEPLTEDAQEAKEEEENDDKEDKFSWASGLTGLLLSVPLLPSLPDVLNPFSRSPDDDDFFPRCTTCNLYHDSNKHSVAEEQHDPATPRRAGGMRDLLYPTLPTRHSFPDVVSSSCDDEHSLYHVVPAISPRKPGDVLSIREDTEALAPYAPVAEPGHLHQYVGKTKKKVLRKCKTAPMLTGLVNFHTKCSETKKPSTAARKKSAGSVVCQATLGLCIYLSLGVVVYTWKREEFSGIETVGVIDALYFCIVTMCTIGYGDITPITPSAKILSCALVFVGFGFIDALMSGMVTFVLDRQEHLLLTVMEDGHHEKTKNVIMDAKKGRMRIRMKVALAVGTVLSAMVVGAIFLHYMEELSWIDALYATCISITTVGYGDVSFQTSSGRLFAAVWLLFSTLGVARAFLFLAEARVHSRHRHLAKRVLQRKMTTNDLMAMDLDNDGHVSKSEFVVYKLKEMGKIDESDIAEICKQFDDIDDANAGKITLAQLLEGEG